MRALGRHGPLLPGVPHGQGLLEPGAVAETACQGKARRHDNIFTVRLSYEVLGTTLQTAVGVVVCTL